MIHSPRIIQFPRQKEEFQERVSSHHNSPLYYTTDVFIAGIPKQSKTENRLKKNENLFVYVTEKSILGCCLIQLLDIVSKIYLCGLRSQISCAHWLYMLFLWSFKLILRTPAKKRERLLFSLLGKKSQTQGILVLIGLE